MHEDTADAAADAMNGKMVGTGETVLVAEDDPDDVFLLQRAFKKASLANPLQIVSNGEEAIAYLDGRGVYADRATYPLPVLVLLDLKLPRRNGLEVLEWVRGQGERFSALPLVMLTSSSQNPDVRRAYELGANSYLIKPVDFDEMLSMIRTLGMYWVQMNRRPLPEISSNEE